MGVYVFGVVDTDWIKVGHHRITSARPNVYYRVARRGFHSCVHPPELQHHRLDVECLELLHWYPALGRREERLAHRACRVSCGEFHARSDLVHVVACLNGFGTAEEVPESDRIAALRWAKKV